MVTFRHIGGFKKTDRFFEKLKEVVNLGDFDKYGKMGVDALKSVTPVDTGKTASSWDYEIKHDKYGTTISWTNDNLTDSGRAPIVILLQYGHATEDGYFIKGKDFINPAMRPVFEKIAKDAWEEVKNL